MNNKALVMLWALCMGVFYPTLLLAQVAPEEVETPENVEVENEAPFETSLFSLDIEAFAAKALDTNNRNLFNFGGGGSLYVNVNPAHWVSLQVGFTGLALGSKDSPDSTHLYGLSTGPRFHLGKWIGIDDDLFVDGHYNFSRSGPVARSGFDVGAGYRFAMNEKRSVFFGPYARYYWGSDPGGDNPSVLMAGVSLSFGKRGYVERDLPAKAPCPDLDGDGFCDADDHCPAEAAGPNPDPEKPGCPLRDTDGDGIFDRDDACPLVPGLPNEVPSLHGCPPLGPPVAMEILSSEPVYFAFDVDVPLTSESDKLKTAAEYFLRAVKHDKTCSMQVEGHTDSVGRVAYNKRLALRRANNVKKELVRLGVPAHLVVVESFGPHYPAASNDTVEGRAKNRRAEFVYLICE